MTLKDKTLSLFADRFGYPASLVIQAPGRVNLIGEHTDYNDGFVLPCAIDYQTVVACAARDDRRVRVIAADYDNQIDEFSLDAPILPHEKQQWSNYVRGVVKHLQQRDNRIGGADLVISGNVPQGAGLSSSASLEVAVGKVFQQLWDLALDGTQLALNGQEAENQFVGCNCGIMDQLISALGEEGSALLIDCRSLNTKAVPMPQGVAVVIINSNFKRTLVGSEYNTRREQCETGARFFQQKALRDVSLDQFNAVAHDNEESNINVRAAALHVLGDLLGSVGAIVAAFVILWTGWTPIDPLLSILVSCLVLRSAWRLLKESVNELLEGAPGAIDITALKKRLSGTIPEVRNIHHVHLWLVGEQPLMTLHVQVIPPHDHDELLERIHHFLAHEYQIAHATVQMEYQPCGVEDCKLGTSASSPHHHH